MAALTCLVAAGWLSVQALWFFSTRSLHLLKVRMDFGWNCFKRLKVEAAKPPEVWALELTVTSTTIYSSVQI